MLKFDEMDSYPIEFLIENTQIEVDKDFVQSVVGGFASALEYSSKVTDDLDKQNKLTASLFSDWLPLCILLKLRNYDYPYDSHTSKIMRTLLLESIIKYKGFCNIHSVCYHNTTESMRAFSVIIKSYCIKMFNIPEEKFVTDFKSAKQILNHHLEIFMKCALYVKFRGCWKRLLESAFALIAEDAYSHDRYIKFVEGLSYEPINFDCEVHMRKNLLEI